MNLVSAWVSVHFDWSFMVILSIPLIQEGLLIQEGHFASFGQKSAQVLVNHLED